MIEVKFTLVYILLLKSSEKISYICIKFSNRINPIKRENITYKIIIV